MTSRSPLLACGVLVLAAAAAPVSAQPGEPGPKWSIDAGAGSSWFHPDDLNGFSLAREETYPVAQSAASALRAGVNVPSTVGGPEFPLLSRGLAFGIDGAYRLGPRFSVTAGIRYVSQQHSSNLTRTFRTTVVDPAAVRFEIVDRSSFDFTPVLLAATTYAPSLGLRYAVLRSRMASIEGVLRGGPVHASCRIEENRTSQTDYYGLNSSTATTMEGSGWGVNLEAGARFAWRPRSRWGAFAEVLYGLERLGSVSGTMERVTTTRDGNASEAERVLTETAAGTWTMVPSGRTLAGVISNQPYPTIASGQGGGSAFALNLSGVRVRAGVTVGFGRR